MRVLFFCIFIILSSFADDFASQKKEFAKTNAAFDAFKKSEESAFGEYKERLEQEFTAYKKELEVFWSDPKLSTQKEWVHYGDDKKSRSKVDFEKSLVVVEVIAKDEKSAKKEMLKQLAYIASKDTKEVIETDELQKRVAKLSQKEQRKKLEIDAKPILQTVLFEKKPTEADVKNYAQKSLKKNKIEQTKSKLKDQIVYKVSVALPSDTRLKRARVYKADVIQSAKRFDIPAALIFAVIQTESDFNPFAKSHIPAYGLMQIVPRSAGRDTYKFLYKRDGMPSATYLYDGKKNIVMGTSYLHILYYRYLKGVKNPLSRLYCAIAAYNTGAGNIAWAYTKTHSVRNATPLINAMNPEEAYAHLLKHLRYDEPKRYLKKVRTRMSAYKNAYEL